jgi:Transposase DDE domain group 1
MQHNGWDHALKVTADGTGLVGHAGAVLLRKAADQAGLTAHLSAALRKKGTSPVFDRGIVLVSLAAAIALGATSMSDIALPAHLAPVLGDAPSGPTARRALDLAGTPAMLDKIARARAHVWELIQATPAGFPWLVIAGKTLAGWLVIDMDATLVTASSDKEGAAPTWKKGYGFPYWAPGSPIPANRWPCCWGRATPARTRSPTIKTCSARRSGRSRPGSGTGSWSASTGPEPATSSSLTCCRCPPRAGSCCSPAGG